MWRSEWIRTRAHSPWGCSMRWGAPWAFRNSPMTPGGHDCLIDWVNHHGPTRVIGIEGSGSYGAAVAQRFLQAGDDVREVPAFMSHREPKKNPSRGKSDVNDAIAIAQVVARGEGLSSLCGRRFTRISSSSPTTVTSSFALGRD